LESSIDIILFNLEQAHINSRLSKVEIVEFSKESKSKLLEKGVPERIIKSLYPKGKSQPINSSYISDTDLALKLQRIIGEEDSSQYSKIIIKEIKVNRQRLSYNDEIKIYTSILLGLIASWSEEAIKTLFFEPNAFEWKQVDKLHDATAENKWSLALKIAFCRANKVKYNEKDPFYKKTNIDSLINIGQPLRSKYKTLEKLIEEELKSITNKRNKVQHGEWVHAFYPTYSKKYDKNGLTKSIDTENIITIESSYNIMRTLYSMMLDLSTFYSGNYKRNKGKTPFDDLFPDKYRKIEKFLLDKDKNLGKYISGKIKKKNIQDKYTSKE
jgi:hypothetical protein